MAKGKFNFSQLTNAMKKVNPYMEYLGKDESSQILEYIDTGYPMLNALFNGHILSGLGGVPDNRIICIGGESGTFKSKLMLEIAKNAIEQNNYNIYYIDTEFALDKATAENSELSEIAMNENFVRVQLENNTVQDLNTFLTNLCDKLMEVKKSGEEIPKVMVFCDSIGALTTKKAISDAIEGEDKTDFTKAKVLHAMFANVTTKMGMLRMPFIFTNHIYVDPMNMYADVKLKGGNAVLYMPSITIILAKSKIKKEEGIAGDYGDYDQNSDGLDIKARAFKNRFIKPKVIRFRMSLSRGKLPFHGLEDFCTFNNFDKTGIGQVKREKDGTFSEGGNKWYVRHLDKYVAKKDFHTPEVFTPEVMKTIDAIVYDYFEFKTQQEIEEINKLYDKMGKQVGELLEEGNTPEDVFNM